MTIIVLYGQSPGRNLNLRLPKHEAEFLPIRSLPPTPQVMWRSIWRKYFSLSLFEWYLLVLQFHLLLGFPGGHFPCASSSKLPYAFVTSFFRSVGRASLVNIIWPS
jgi:hypothetical protein